MRGIIATSLISLFIVACAAEADELEGGRGKKGKTSKGDDDDDTHVISPTGEATDDPGAPGSCKEGAPHPGFASFDFVSDRKPGAIGDNRGRVKPFSMMNGELQRTLGVVPATLAESAGAFGETPARWYGEPQAGAVSLFTTYNVAFTGCYDSMTGPEFAAAPNETTAAEQCAKLQRKAWQRAPSPDEIKGCADLVMSLTTENVARRRWAHGCAAVMTSAGFTTY
ncbi:MAG: hypothetical protein KIT84_29360 [Labilithrix sp.]|nr:hypothetical protein [Labilithrix sp.]MCW5815171.1 hypothetical protein [Labilithrix sp.]